MITLKHISYIDLKCDNTLGRPTKTLHVYLKSGEERVFVGKRRIQQFVRWLRVESRDVADRIEVVMNYRPESGDWKETVFSYGWDRDAWNRAEDPLVDAWIARQRKRRSQRDCGPPQAGQ
jgi:hypothetical protein